MKISTLRTVIALLDDLDFDGKEAIMNDLRTDVNKNDAKKAANEVVYNAAHDTVMTVLKSTDAPLTAAEIFEEIANDLPDFSKGQLVRALTRNWVGEVVKIDGKVSTYRYKWETA